MREGAMTASGVLETTKRAEKTGALRIVFMI
jgi:hypothetical protein